MFVGVRGGGRGVPVRETRFNNERIKELWWGVNL